MEIDRYAFPHILLEIIESISLSPFVAIDFEFSGVAANAPRSTGRVKDSLQDRYRQLKAAATKYTILQAGICCAGQDKDTGEWRLSTYNFPISPVLNEELEVLRDFAFQSGAVQFLNRNGFDFGASMSSGVQYLSRSEEELALANAVRRNDRSQVEDIVLGEQDKEALQFMQQVRSTINAWLKRRQHMTRHAGASLHSVDINHRIDSSGTKKELSSFDRRLVYQVVRTDYPNLISIGRGTEMTIRFLDKAREAQYQAARLERAKIVVQRHIGFRRVIDILSGQDIGDADFYRVIQSDPAYSSPYCDLDESSEDELAVPIPEQLARINARLKVNRPALVGHNVLNDLVYLHQAFLGQLPDTVGEFASSVNRFFPTLFDTKYLVTHDCAAMNPASALAQVDQELAFEALEFEKSLPTSLPSTSLSEQQARPRKPVGVSAGTGEFAKYDKAQSLHEAGYDAFITARVFVRLAAKLGNEITTAALKDDKAWSPFRNRCRVFGTNESVLDLEATKIVDADGGVSLI